MASLLTSLVLASAQELQLIRHSIDGGGLVRSTGGDLELAGTVGQPDAGLLVGGDLQLSGGFWFGLAGGDCDEDGRVSRFDTAEFTLCMTGPGAMPIGPCRCFDIDVSGAVDLADFASVQTAYVAP